MICAIVFDADDTLWQTEVLYDRALEFAEQLVRDAGIDAACWRQLQRDIDLEAVKRMGYSRKRFPTSSVDAYRRLADRIDPVLQQKIYTICSEVFLATAHLQPGVDEVLSLLSREYHLAAVTKGDPEVQHKRMGDSQLLEHFDIFAIVEEKTPSTFEAICSLLSLPPDCVVSVGNSIRSDILPARHAGLNTIWIDAPVWQHEQFARSEIPSDVMIASQLADVPSLIEQLLQVRK